MRVQRWLWLKSLSESRQCLPQDSLSAISWKDGFVLFSNLRLGRQLKRHEKLHNSRKRLFPATKSNIDWMSAEMWEREGDATTARTNSYRCFRVRCFCLTPKYYGFLQFSHQAALRKTHSSLILSGVIQWTMLLCCSNSQLILSSKTLLPQSIRPTLRVSGNAFIILLFVESQDPQICFFFT